MATIINGSDLFMFLDDTIVAHATSHTLTLTMASRNTSNKDSGNYDTHDVGRYDPAASCEGLVAYGSNWSAVLAAIAAREPVKLEFGKKDGTSLDETVWYASGNFIITGWEHGAPDGDNATYSLSFEHHSEFDIDGTVT